MTETPAETETPPEAPAQESEQETKPEIDWKSKAREWEKRAKENKAAADRLSEMEESSKTEAQKLADRAAKAETELNELRLASLRSDVALEKGLTAAQARRLIGETREELEADADLFLADLGETGKPRAPRPDANQGRSGAGAPKSTADSFAEFFRNNLPER
jgi:hypothetical protein